MADLDDLVSAEFQPYQGQSAAYYPLDQSFFSEPTTTSPVGNELQEDQPFAQHDQPFAQYDQPYAQHDQIFNEYDQHCAEEAQTAAQIQQYHPVAQHDHTFSEYDQYHPVARYDHTLTENDHYYPEEEQIAAEIPRQFEEAADVAEDVLNTAEISSQPLYESGPPGQGMISEIHIAYPHQCSLNTAAPESFVYPDPSLDQLAPTSSDPGHYPNAYSYAAEVSMPEAEKKEARKRRRVAKRGAIGDL
jgi:hypothetical protein